MRIRYLSIVPNILENGTSTEGEKVRPHWEDERRLYDQELRVVNRYDLSREFPALTLRRTALKTCMEELLWIWQKKSNNVHDLNSGIGTHGQMKVVPSERPMATSWA